MIAKSLQILMAVAVLMGLAATPARAESFPTVAAFVQGLKDSGASKDIFRAANIMAPDGFTKETRQNIVSFLKDVFADNAFQVDVLHQVSTEELGAQRVIAMYHEYNYIFLYVMLHRRGAEWRVVSFDANTDYAEIADNF